MMKVLGVNAQSGKGNNPIYEGCFYKKLELSITFNDVMNINTKQDKYICCSLKVKTSIGNAPISKNEMEALITNHVKEYVLTYTLFH